MAAQGYVTPFPNKGKPATSGWLTYFSDFVKVGLGAHLHTYSSRGGWVLGVMIQGATRKVTLSVKTDTSERGWERGGLGGFVGSWVPHTSP